MEQYTNLKRSIGTDARGINCLSDEPSTFHAVQFCALQFALQLGQGTGIYKTATSETGMRDHCIALDHYIKNVSLRWWRKPS